MKANHFLLQLRVHAAQRGILVNRASFLERHGARVGQRHVANRRYVAGDADAEAAEELPRERSGPLRATPFRGRWRAPARL